MEGKRGIHQASRQFDMKRNLATTPNIQVYNLPKYVTQICEENQKTWEL